jgi:IS66 C-terminal element
MTGCTRHWPPEVGDGASGAARCLPGPEGPLFAGSDDGVERAAATYALTGSAKPNSLDPELCLRQVLERIADHPIQRLSELLPRKDPLL